MTHKHEHTVSLDTAVVLRSHGFRVTSARQALLEVLSTAGVPLSVQEIARRFEGKSPDVATLYRSLTDLHAAGVVKRVELGTGMAHFEYTPERPHHHHIVCVSCGVIAELAYCALGDIEDEVLRRTKQFSLIYSHNLEFFGRCTKCTA